MRIKLDENIADSAAGRLTALGHDVHTVLDEPLGGRIDSEVWAAAQQEDRFLITQDLDFSDQRRFAAGTHAGVLLVRLPDSEQWRIADYLVAWFSTHDASTWTGVLSLQRPTKSECSAPSNPDCRSEVPGTSADQLNRARGPRRAGRGLHRRRRRLPPASRPCAPLGRSDAGLECAHRSALRFPAWKLSRSGRSSLPASYELPGVPGSACFRPSVSAGACGRTWCGKERSLPLSSYPLP
jgi:predicted nuclease of predicted toxin-antitoxin system